MYAVFGKIKREYVKRVMVVKYVGMGTFPCNVQRNPRGSWQEISSPHSSHLPPLRFRLIQLIQGLKGSLNSHIF